VIRVVLDDLAFVEADAVVRPATTLLEPTTPAIGRLDEAAGTSFTTQLRETRALVVGAAVVTGAGDLAAELVIHAIIRSATEQVTPLAVRRAWTSVLQRASAWELAHIATPPLGTGAGNLSTEVAAETMVAVLTETDTGTAYPRDVTIVVETDEERSVFEAALKRMTP
jgi:O-acetyl-ADP-ribose deacetylase (regulator of RNase III)